jgi:hypothetical protein
MIFLGVEPRSVGVVLAEGLRDGEAGRAPFLIMPWHSPYNWGKARKTSVRAAYGLDESGFIPERGRGFLL